MKMEAALYALHTIFMECVWANSAFFNDWPNVSKKEGVHVQNYWDWNIMPTDMNLEESDSSPLNDQIDATECISSLSKKNGFQLNVPFGTWSVLGALQARLLNKKIAPPYNCTHTNVTSQTIIYPNPNPNQKKFQI